MKNVGVRWAVLDQLESSGWIIGIPILWEEDIDGYAQSLRDAPNGEKVQNANDTNPIQTG